MLSRDQADKVSDSLLEPPRQELEEKQAKLAKRRAERLKKRLSPLIPAGVGAAVALLTVDYFSKDMTAFIAGAVAGWAVARLLSKST